MLSNDTNNSCNEITDDFIIRLRVFIAANLNGASYNKKASDKKNAAYCNDNSVLLTIQLINHLLTFSNTSDVKKMPVSTTSITQQKKEQKRRMIEETIKVIADSKFKQEEEERAINTKIQEHIICIQELISFYVTNIYSKYIAYSYEIVQRDTIDECKHLLNLFKTIQSKCRQFFGIKMVMDNLLDLSERMIEMCNYFPLEDWAIEYLMQGNTELKNIVITLG